MNGEDSKPISIRISAFLKNLIQKHRAAIEADGTSVTDTDVVRRLIEEGARGDLLFQHQADPAATLHKIEYRAASKTLIHQDVQFLFLYCYHAYLHVHGPFIREKYIHLFKLYYELVAVLTNLGVDLSQHIEHARGCLHCNRLIDNYLDCLSTKTTELQESQSYVLGQGYEMMLRPLMTIRDYVQYIPISKLNEIINPYFSDLKDTAKVEIVRETGKNFPFILRDKIFENLSYDKDKKPLIVEAMLVDETGPSFLICNIGNAYVSFDFNQAIFMWKDMHQAISGSLGAKKSLFIDGSTCYIHVGRVRMFMSNDEFKKLLEVFNDLFIYRKLKKPIIEAGISMFGII